MKRPVEWSRDALDDIKNQMAYIAAENPTAARRVADQIRAALPRLLDLVLRSTHDETRVTARKKVAPKAKRAAGVARGSMKKKIRRQAQGQRKR